MTSHFHNYHRFPEHKQMFYIQSYNYTAIKLFEFNAKRYIIVTDIIVLVQKEEFLYIFLIYFSNIFLLWYFLAQTYHLHVEPRNPFSTNCISANNQH